VYSDECGVVSEIALCEHRETESANPSYAFHGKKSAASRVAAWRNMTCRLMTCAMIYHGYRSDDERRGRWSVTT